MRQKWPDSRIKVALWNASQWSRIPFQEVTERVCSVVIVVVSLKGIIRTFKPVFKSICTSIITPRCVVDTLALYKRVAAFAWSQEAINAMLEPATGTSPDDMPGGTVLFTGATSSIRGASGFATFAAGKHGLRALSQSLAREFGKREIHVAHVIIDGTILTKKTREMFGGKKKLSSTPGETSEGGEDWMDDDSRRLDPVSVAKVDPSFLLILHFVDHIVTGFCLASPTGPQCMDARA